MKRGEGACLICGEPIIYYDKMQEFECAICHGTFSSNASCEKGHFVCDECHEKRGVEIIMEYCLSTNLRNPIQMIDEMMENPYIYMHGPEHHIMVGAALLTAYMNAGGDLNLEEALAEMKARGSRYPGGSCGLWGACGAAVSCGMYISIMTKANPLTTKSWQQANRMTSRCLEAVAALGGPRCCKRNSFTTIKEAVKFTEEEFGVKMELPEEIKCRFSYENVQCKKKACPYYAK
ncbi:MAG: SAM-dependent methyltransferase [Firmicutes bacterium]|nr:SAM-dependent methyltransferase [Bacillota bacterium]